METDSGKPARRSRSFPRALRHLDRKSTRLNSSHGYISYAVFCLKKKNSADHSYDQQHTGRAKDGHGGAGETAVIFARGVLESWSQPPDRWSNGSDTVGPGESTRP